MNPLSHVITSDSRSITLLKSDIEKSRKENGKKVELGDEELLARFVEGFFGGWSFTPERSLLSLISKLGRKFIPVGYTGMETNGKEVNCLEALSKMKLPDKGTVLFGGNFMVLDTHLASPLSQKDDLNGSYVDIGSNDPVISYVDIGFGDNRRSFAGLHRFEVQHHTTKEEGEEEEEKVTIWFSSMSCNPSVDRPPFPKWVFKFHLWYSMCLFKDGIEGMIWG